MHLFEHWPGASRQPALASEAAERLAEFIRLIEPIRRASRDQDTVAR
jgi:hypothetical protein